MIKKTLTGESMTVDFDVLASILIAGFILFKNDIESLLAGYYLEGMENIKNEFSRVAYAAWHVLCRLKHTDAINRHY